MRAARVEQARRLAEAERAEVDAADTGATGNVEDPTEDLTRAGEELSQTREESRRG